MHSKLPENKRQRIFARLESEPSDTILAREFGVHRKTIWRLRKEADSKRAESLSTTRKNKTIPPPPTSNPPKVKIPPMATPNIHTKLEPSKAPPKSASQATTVPTGERHVDVSPKVNTVKVQLGTYFAVQRLGRDNYKNVSEAVLEAAYLHKILFRKLQILELMSVGATSFFRFRSDVEDVSLIIEELLKERAVISQGLDGGYKARFPNGKTGKVSTALMCLEPKGGYGQTYAGTRIRRWRDQFK